MSDALGLRELTVWTGGDQIADGNRIHLQGKSVMNSMPDMWLLEMYGLSSGDLALLRNGGEVSVLGPKGSLLCSGVPADIMTRTEGGKDVTVVMLMEGEAFWRSTVSMTMSAGASLRQTLLTLLARCSSPIPLVSCPEVTISMPRGQTFFGRTADAVDELARAAGLRGWVWQDGLYLARKGEGVARRRLTEDQLLRDPERMACALIVNTSAMGLMTGQLVELDNGYVYRLASQTVDADSWSGPWESVLTLTDESGKAWEGVT